MMKMNNNVEAIIALRIIEAQIASDSGKGLKRLNVAKQYSRSYKHLGYALKGNPIVEALKLIRANKTRFNYWCCEAPDQNGNDSIIVYFDFKLNDTRYQVSFHNHGVKELRNYINTGRKTHWFKQINSLESCKALQRFYDIPEEGEIFEGKYERYSAYDDYCGSYRQQRQGRRRRR